MLSLQDSFIVNIPISPLGDNSRDSVGVIQGIENFFIERSFPLPECFKNISEGAAVNITQQDIPEYYDAFKIFCTQEELTLPPLSLGLDRSSGLNTPSSPYPTSTPTQLGHILSPTDPVRQLVSASSSSSSSSSVPDCRPPSPPVLPSSFFNKRWDAAAKTCKQPEKSAESDDSDNQEKPTGGQASGEKNKKRKDNPGQEHIRVLTQENKECQARIQELTQQNEQHQVRFQELTKQNEQHQAHIQALSQQLQVYQQYVGHHLAQLLQLLQQQPQPQQQQQQQQPPQQQQQQQQQPRPR